MKNSKGTPSKDTGAKNGDSNNDVDYKNSNQTSDTHRTSTSNKSKDNHSTK